ncbi:hypothetical protein BH09VER1_BH09VER1_07470 [soil metagenome]
MKLLDWILLIAPILFVLALGIVMQRRVKSVAGFMSGGRLADRYLLTVAKGEMGIGAVVFVASFEKFERAGFTLTWWQWIHIPIVLLIAISGFVIYRYRETRAMTLAQFFEIRYSRNFRLFSGSLGFLAGILNFGVIPAVGARCLVYILGLPGEITVWSCVIPTHIPLMALLLGITLFITLTGGLITVMITDCVEGILSQIGFLIIVAALLLIFKWDQIAQVLSDRPPGKSLIDPFDSFKNEDFNLWYVLIMMFLGAYGTMAWQNASGFNSAASSPHESRMANVLGRWRELGKGAVVIMLAVCAVTFLKHPDFAAQAAPASEILNQISQPQIQKQMQIPVAISLFLPIGVKGILCAIFAMGIFGGDSSQLHSWGGIFVQDVLLPLRKKPFSQEQHIRCLRWAIAGVAVFAFLFGSLYRQTEYLFMWFAVTMTVFVGGAGSAIIGGLYWKKGTTAAAWTAMIVGCLLSTGGILARQMMGTKFPWNGAEVAFFATLVTIALYVIVSMLTCREDFNMDRMLHRGKYAAVSSPEQEQAKKPRRQALWARMIGIDGSFTLGDRWIAGSLFSWGLFWFLVTILGAIWHWIAPWPKSFWLPYWRFAGIWLPVMILVITSIWFTWGGLRDLRTLFERLRIQKVNPLDDGTVIDHQNLDEKPVEAPVAR